MIPIIKPLPHWVLTENNFAFYDTEAVTVLELLSKIYGKIDEVVSVVNLQDSEIEDAIKYMKTNLVSTINTLFEEGLEAGTFTASVTITYNAEGESLTISDTLTESES